ncbi:MAG: hypothetical protein U1F75_05000 [Plasticicumulans sp.]
MNTLDELNAIARALPETALAELLAHARACASRRPMIWATWFDHRCWNRSATFRRGQPRPATIVRPPSRP